MQDLDQIEETFTGVTFRPRSDQVVESLANAQETLKDYTSHRKTSGNQTLNFLVILGGMKLQEMQENLETKREEAQEMQQEAVQYENKLKQVMDF